MSGAERRTAERFDARIPIEYQAGEGDFLFENTENISKGGLFVATPTPEKLGTVLELRFKNPGTDESIKVEGEVVWANDPEDGKDHPNPGMGIQFLKMDEETKEAVLRLVGAIAYI